MIDIRRSLLYIITLPFLIGIAIGSFVNVSLIVVEWILFLLGMVMIGNWLRKTNNLFAAMCICFFFFVFGIFCFCFAEYRLQSTVIHQFANQEVVLQGIIVKEPISQAFSQKIIVKVKEIKNENSTTTLNQRILVQAPFSSSFYYGDEVVVKGKLERPRNFTNEIGREVNYQAILKKDGILYGIRKPIITITSHGKGSKIISILLSAKENFISKIKEVLPEPDASLAGGMLLGEKQSLGKELTEKLRTVGLIHIVVLSGYNIALVALFIEKIGSMISKRFSYLLSGIGIVIFVIMVGGGATVIRAGIMGMLAIGTQITRRSYDAGRALWAAAFVMVFLNPFILMFDMSFQLSFLATLGIVYVTPIFEYFWPMTKGEFLKGVITTTLATQIIVAPFLIYMTGSLSVISLLTNVLVVPLTPFLMAVSFAVAIAWFIHFLIALPFVFVAHVLFTYMMWVVEFFSSLSFASIKNINLSLRVVGVLYILLTVSVIYLHKKYNFNVKRI